MATVAGWSEAEDRLVDMWKTYPCLFDTSCKAFSNRNARRNAIDTMAASLDKSADEVCKKMKSMRTQFSRMLKVPASGSGRKGSTVHQQWMLKNLDFLKPHLKARETSSSYQLAQDDDESDEDVLSEGEMNTSTEAPSPVSFPEESTPTSFPKHPGPSQRKQAKRAHDNSRFLESIAKSLEKPIELPDADDDAIFGNYIASRLRNIKDQRIKAQLIWKINQAVSEAEFWLLGMQNNINHPEHTENHLAQQQFVSVQRGSGMDFPRDQYRLFQNL